MEQIVYLNGSFLSRYEASISPFDYGFLYGYGLFETMRAYSGRIFRLSQHLERLEKSALIIGLPVDTGRLEEICYSLIRVNQLGDCRVRIQFSMGEGPAIPDIHARPDPTTFIVATPYSAPSKQTYRDGFRAVISSLRQNSRSPLSRVKSTNYLLNLLARREGRDAGVNEVILLNERGAPCEGGTTNIFIVKDGKLVTPDLESGCLPGVTREAVLELASNLSLPFREREVRIEELFQADEAFLTNSLVEIMPLREVDRKKIGTDLASYSQGLTSRLAAAYRELVAGETTLLR